MQPRLRWWLRWCLLAAPASAVLLVGRRETLCAAAVTGLAAFVPPRAPALPSAVQASVGRVQVAPAPLDLAPVAPGTVRFLLCRHGETEYNRLKLAQGRRIDAPLNPTGELQAHALGAVLGAGGSVSVVASSELQRARSTADIVAEAVRSPERDQAPPRRVLAELDEVDFGEVEGRRTTALLSAYQRWCSGDLDARISPGGESAREVQERVLKAVRLLAKEVRTTGDAGVTVAAVSHSVLLRFVISVVGGVPLPIALGLDQRNCCINAIDIGPRGESRVRCLNYVKHLTDRPESLVAARRAPAPVRAVQKLAAKGIVRVQDLGPPAPPLIIPEWDKKQQKEEKDDN